MQDGLKSGSLVHHGQERVVLLDCFGRGALWKLGSG
jgi:hypothetical protein